MEIKQQMEITTTICGYYFYKIKSDSEAIVLGRKSTTDDKKSLKLKIKFL